MFTKLQTEWKAKMLAKDLKSILFPRGFLMEYSSLKAIILEYVSPALVGEQGSYFPPACSQSYLDPPWPPELAWNEMNSFSSQGGKGPISRSSQHNMEPLHRLKSRDIGGKLETDQKVEEEQLVENSSYNELDINNVKTTDEEINDVAQTKIFNYKQGNSLTASAKGLKRGLYLPGPRLYSCRGMVAEEARNSI